MSFSRRVLCNAIVQMVIELIALLVLTFPVGIIVLAVHLPSAFNEVVVELLIALITFGVYFSASKYLERRPLAEMGLPRSHAMRGLLLGFTLGACLIIIIGILALAGWYHITSIEPAGNVPAVILEGLIVFFCAAVFEEVLFRGIAFRLLEQELGSWIAIGLSAVEDRLQRARLQLRQVLSCELREEALAFGLALNSFDARGWRESRVWCVLCGQHRLRGLLTALPDGTYGLRLRCPHCSQRYGEDIFSAERIALTRGMRSFHPIYKKMVLAEKTSFALALKRSWQQCQRCGSQVPIQITESQENICPLPEHIWVVLSCPACHHIVCSSVTSIVCWTDPVVAPLAQRFMTEHPRWFAEPATRVAYAGFSAFRIRLVDVSSIAQLTIFAHAQTLCALACFPG